MEPFPWQRGGKTVGVNAPDPLDGAGRRENGRKRMELLINDLTQQRDAAARG